MKLPEGLALDHAEISKLEFGDKSLGFECFIFRPEEPLTAFSGGFGKTEDLAKQIAISEAIERHLLERLWSSDPQIQGKWGLDINSTSSGFAFSSFPVPASQRSLSEAYEHFVRYHALNQGRAMESFRVAMNTTELIGALTENFDEIHWFKQTQEIEIQDFRINLTCLILVTRIGKGLFIGAKASPDREVGQMAEHCLVEAWRNARIARKSATMPQDQKSWTRKRTEFFASNWSLGFAKLNTNPSGWPAPKIILFHTEKFDSVDGYLSRALCEGIPASREIGFDELA